MNTEGKLKFKQQTKINIMTNTDKNDLNATIGNTVLPAVLDFGDYCTIEQYRYGCDNEHYIHKVIGRLSSNTWVDVPVMHNAKETLHDHIEDVVACVCCGVSEREILRYRLSDVRKHGR